MDTRLADFLALSSTLTGFSIFDLRGTGQDQLYLATVSEIVGEDGVAELLASSRRVLDQAGEDEAAIENAMRREILSNDKLGPIARNVIKLWYTGVWQALPREWRDKYGSSDMDRTFVVSPDSYTEGLLWPCIGANPSGAKPFGYGMWAKPPRIETT